MILEVENWHLGYSQILKDCRTASDGSVWILCNADVDAMSAARILCYMLRSDGITHQLRPCTSYTSLRRILGDAPDDVQAVVLLNLGASRNLTNLLNAKVYVMDCRRPVHLANVYAGQNVVLFWDQYQDIDIPSDGDNLSGNENTTSEEDSSSSSESEEEEEDLDEGEEEFRDEDEEEFDSGPTERPQQLSEDREYDGEDEGDAQDDEDVNDDPTTKSRSRPDSTGSPSRQKRQKTDRTHHDEDSSVTTKEGDEESPAKPSDGVATPSLTPQELHRQRRNRVRLYYNGGSFYGIPAAYVAYLLSTQLRFGELGDLLWLACVGVTDAYVNARLDKLGYARLALEMKSYCLRIYPNDMYHQVGNTVYAEHLLGNPTTSDALTKISLSGSGQIYAQQDFRFFLLRHTSLFDSMVYSNHVSTKLQLWSRKGMARFQELLAKMGCPLDECRQPFAFMKPKLRRTLSEKFETYAEEYGLENLTFTSFQRLTGYKSSLSASDMSYAVTALLECDTPATKSTSDDPQDEEEAEANRAFNIAYDALNSNASPSVILNEGHAVSNLVNGGNMSGDTGIGAGIRLAMSLQKSIINVAVSLVERNAITRLRHFRYAYITCTSQENLGDTDEADQHHVFSKPLALTKLAHYLMDMHRENHKWTGAKSRPLVLCAEKPRTGTYMVVGYEFPEHAGNAVHNRFGQNFETVAQSMNGTFRFDSFDSNVVEVDANDVQRFIEQLHYILDSM